MILPQHWLCSRNTYQKHSFIKDGRRHSSQLLVSAVICHCLFFTGRSCCAIDQWSLRSCCLSIRCTRRHSVHSTRSGTSKEYTNCPRAELNDFEACSAIIQLVLLLLAVQNSRQSGSCLAISRRSPVLRSQSSRVQYQYGETISSRLVECPTPVNSRVK